MLARTLMTALALLGMTGTTAAPVAQAKRAPKHRGHGDRTYTQTASGGAGFGASPPSSSPGAPDQPTVTGDTAKIVNGVAYAPQDAPQAVKQAIWAGNAIRHKPYKYGGGHGTWQDSGYDCSGSVSYILHAAGLIKTSMDSSDFMSWGQHGPGQWITVYTNPGHAFVQIAGIRLDTSAEQDPHPAPGDGPRWRPLMKSTDGFQARHLSAY